WAGVPVTTARRAAALLRAKLAAERTARVTPSTRGGSLRSCSTRKNNPMLVSWLAAPPRPRSAPRAFLPLLLGWLASAIVHRSRILSQHHRARVCCPIAGAALALQRLLRAADEQRQVGRHLAVRALGTCEVLLQRSMDVFACARGRARSHQLFPRGPNLLV